MNSNLKAQLSLARIILPLMLCVFFGGMAQAKNSKVPTAATDSNVAYTVRKGDTLGLICRKYNISMTNCKQVGATNQLDNAKLPEVGSLLYIPLDVLPSESKSIRVVKTIGKVTVAGKEVRANHRFDEKKQIKVANNSSAVIEMADGSRAKLLPNSVAEVVHSRYYRAPDQTAGGKIISWFGSKIRLLQGALELSVKKSPHKRRVTPMEVKTTTSLLGVRGTRFRVAAADKFVPFDRAEVLEGEVNNINTWHYASINVVAGKGVVTYPNKSAMKAVELLPAPVVPNPGQILRRPQAYWKFSPVPGAVAYRVLAAYDADFNSVIYSEKSTTPLVDLSRLANGKWYVRARAIDASGLEGLDATTSIDLRQPDWVLRGLSVNVNGHIPYLMWRDIVVAQSADPIQGNSTVTVEVARDAKFKKPIATLKTNSNQVKLPHMAPANYYLRVQLDNEAIKSDEVQVFKLHIPVRKHLLAYHLLLSRLR